MNDPVEKKWREDLGEHKNERERERERENERKVSGVCVCVCVRVPRPFLANLSHSDFSPQPGYLGVYPEFTQKVVNPILQPFCDGLWEPFDGFIWSFKMEMFTYVALSGAAGLLAGYAIGRCKKDR